MPSSPIVRVQRIRDQRVYGHFGRQPRAMGEHVGVERAWDIPGIDDEIQGVGRHALRV